VGKTTLARIIARQLERPFYTLSAVTSGVKDVRDVIDKAKRHAASNSGLFGGQQAGEDRRAVLFIDEIHRFSKSQQDSLLGAVEDGTITLIGATTENPSFEIITPLLSRCQVYVLKPLTKDDLLCLLDRVLREDEYIRGLNVDIKETDSILRYSGGDARKLLNIIELVTNSGVRVIDNDTVTKQLQQNPVAYDKDGELHYDIISAFIKSIRGSDPDAALYWLARMIAAGEDPKFIARRLVISASEDIGLANPNAMLVANACFDTLQKVGWPEGRIPLAMATVYLATSQKSNSAYLAINEAIRLVEKTGDQPVPLHLRNAPTQLMDELGYGQGYQYAHDYPNHFVKQQFMPDELQGTRLWYAQGSPQEQKMAEWMMFLWNKE
jgi:putative ATPase